MYYWLVKKRTNFVKSSAEGSINETTKVQTGQIPGLWGLIPHDERTSHLMLSSHEKNIKM
jgi:hypothetical protein